MGSSCTKIGRHCSFCGKSKWNPRLQAKDDEERLFCGVATGYDTRVEALPICWLEMTKSAITKFRKMKKIEYETLVSKELEQ